MTTDLKTFAEWLAAIADGKTGQYQRIPGGEWMDVTEESLQITGTDYLPLRARQTAVGCSPVRRGNGVTL